MSSSFSRSVRALVSTADNALRRGRINEALRIVLDLVEQIITEPLCTAHVFASLDLDQLCQNIGRQNLLRLGTQQGDPWPDRAERSRVAYVLTRLQKSGGHSLLVLDFIRAQPDRDHLILVTGVSGPSDTDYLTQTFAGHENVRVIFSPRKDLQARLTWLQSMLLGSRPEHVYLFNHHQDSVAVAALVPELGLQGSFCHHGDHHLCLGVHLEHLAHIDFHPMGYHYCRDDLGIDNHYLPLTFEDRGFLPIETAFASGGGLTTATAARSNKIEIPYYVSYLDLIPQMLKVTGGRHIHIGKLTPWAMRRMRAQMREHRVPEDQLVYLEWTPSVWKSLQEHKVDVYLASFPYGAGLTLIEAMGAGVPVIMHQHMYSRVLSGLELAYPEAFCWSDPEDLLSHLAALEPERLELESRLARMRYETFHRPEILKAYLRHPATLLLPVPSLTSDFRPRYDEWAAWAEAQLSFSRLAYRFAYRTWRRIRSSLRT